MDEIDARRIVDCIANLIARQQAHKGEHDGGPAGSA